jgi:hypothetical protein
MYHWSKLNHKEQEHHVDSHGGSIITRSGVMNN